MWNGETKESDTKEIFTIETKNRSTNVISKANNLMHAVIVEAQANNNKLLIKSDREKVIEVVEGPMLMEPSIC